MLPLLWKGWEENLISQKTNRHDSLFAVISWINQEHISPWKVGNWSSKNLKRPEVANRKQD